MSESELLLFASALYGPLLITIALCTYALSLPRARKGARWLERAARRPIFWAIVPQALALVIAARLLLSATLQLAVTAGPPVTLTKTTTAHFAAVGSALDNTMTASGDQLAMRQTTTPSPLLQTGPDLPVLTDHGAHALQGNGEFLIVHGGLRTSSSIYEEATQSARAGPAIPHPAGKGSFSIPLDAGKFLLVLGGDTDPGAQRLKTFVITPAASAGGTWTFVAGPDLSGTVGAGLGAHAAKFSVGGVTKFLIVHGGSQGSRETSLYTPGTNTMAAGPLLTKNAGTGAHSIFRPVDGKFLVVLGKDSKDTNVYDPVANTFSSGPDLKNPVGDGGHAIQYFNAAGQERYLILPEGNDGGAVYDPNALPAATAGMIARLELPGPPPAPGALPKIGPGAMSYQRADGSVVIFAGRDTPDVFVLEPKISTEGQLANLSLSNTLVMGPGSFALQQADGKYLVVGGGGNQTRLHDAGWSTRATYTSEPINPGPVDRWTEVLWNRTATAGLTLSWRAATTADTLAAKAFTVVATPTTGGAAAISPAVTEKWIQVRAAMERALPGQTAAQERVWAGVSTIVQTRTLTAPSPVLLDYALRFTTGRFVLGATSPQTAGLGFTVSIELRDSVDNRITDYRGDRTLFFSSAGIAPDGVSKPTATDRTGAAVPFGLPTGLTFAQSGVDAGRASPTVTLYKKEELDLTVDDSIVAPGPFTAFELTSAVITTATPARIVVNPGAPHAAKSTLTAAPRFVKADGIEAATVTATIADQFGNVLAGKSVSLSSNLGTFSANPMPPTDFNGRSTVTVKSTAAGVASISGTVLGVALAPTTVTFAAISQKITLTKRTTAHFDAAAPTKTSVLTAGDRVALGAQPAGTTVSHASATASVDDGAHTLQGNGDDFLLVHGGGTRATTRFISGSATAGPSFPSTGDPIGVGAFGFAKVDGTYLVVAGGGSKTVYQVTPPASPSGSWSVDFFGASLSGVTGAGAGAHAIRFTQGGATKTLVMHGAGGAGGTATLITSVLADGTIQAGPTLTGLAGAGGFAIAKTNRSVFIAHGGGSTSSTVFSPDAAAPAPQIEPGPTFSTGIGAGGHALQYRTSAGQERFLILHGGGTPTSTAASVYDPSAAAANAGLSARPSAPVGVGAGAHAVLLGDGTYAIFAGRGTTDVLRFTPTPSETLASFAPFTFPAGFAVATGGHSFQKPDGTYAVVAGGGTANVAAYDGGWRLTGTYETTINPKNADRYDTVAWEKTAGTSLTIGVRTAKTQGELAAKTYRDFAAGSGTSGSGSVGGLGGERWAQVRASFSTTVATSSGALQGAWLGSSSVTQDRPRGPALTKLQLTYFPAGFRITATPPASGCPAAGTFCAGVAFTATVTLIDSTAAKVDEYSGPHTLVFAGASTAPDEMSRPTATDKDGAPKQFGQETTLDFTTGAGAATTTLRLFAAENALVSVSETLTAPVQVAEFELSRDSLTTITLDTSAPAAIAVTAATLSADQSSVAASPTNLPADDRSTATISVTVRDAFKNPVAGAAVTLSSSRGSPPDTFVQPAAATSSAGTTSGTVRSKSSGTSAITATACSAAPCLSGVAITQTASVTFGAGSFLITTQNNGTEKAGEPFALTITAKDAQGNTVTSYSGTKTIAFKTDAVARTSPLPGPAPSIPSSLALSFVNGTATTPVPPPATTATLQVTAGFDSKTNKNLGAGQVSDLQSSDDKRVDVDAGFFLSLQFQQGIPTTAAIVSVRIFVEHHEELGIAVNAVKWEVGTGTLPAPTIIATRNAPQLIDPGSEGLQEWDVTSAIDTPAKVNDLKFVVRNTDLAKKTKLDRVYVVVTHRDGALVTSSFFTLYNASQKPTITATDGAFPSGTSAPITVTPGAASLTLSTISVDPGFVLADGRSSATATVLVVDRFANPLSGLAVTVEGSRAGKKDIVVQTAGVTDANGKVTAEIVTFDPGCTNLSAAIDAVGTISTTAGLCFGKPTGAARLEIRTQRDQLETAGQPFSITITATKADGSVDLDFCKAVDKCSLSLTHTAQASPKGNAPTGPTTLTGVQFTSGALTTAAPNLFTFYRANQMPPASITVTVTASDVKEQVGMLGTSPPIRVSPNVVSLTDSFVCVTRPVVPADGTVAPISAKVVDAFGNPISGRTVTLSSAPPRGSAVDTIAQPTAGTDANGLATGSIASFTPGTATIRGNVAGPPGDSGFVKDGAIQFVGGPGTGRVNNGTKLGTVENGAEKVTALKIVARDLACDELPTTSVVWEVTGSGAATFFGGGSTVTVPSGQATPDLIMARAGRITVTGSYLIPAGRPGAGVTVSVSFSVVVVSHLDLQATTSSKRSAIARVEWDGQTVRVLSWVTTEPQP